LEDIEIRVSGSEGEDDEKNDTDDNQTTQLDQVITPTKPSVFVWEWMDDDRNWQPYDSVTSSEIEQGYLAKQSEVDLTYGYFASHSGYVVNFLSSSQINKITQATRSVRRCDTSATSASNSSSAVWYWKDDDGWKAYDKESND